PIANARDEKEAPDPGERARDQIAARRVEAAPWTGIHPVVHAAVAVGAIALEQVLLVPALRASAPGAVWHGVLDTAAAPPVAARVEPEPSGGLERPFARVAILVDVGIAPGAEGVSIADDPPASEALRAGHMVEVLPLLGPAAVWTECPVALELLSA